MHPTIQALPNIPPVNHYVIINPQRQVYNGSCKESLITKLLFKRAFEDHTVNSDVYFTFAIEDFKQFKEKVKAVFKLFTQETPCNFYKLDDRVIVRLKPDSFFRSSVLLTDFFTVLIRFLSLRGVAFLENDTETLNRLKGEVNGFYWGGTNYASSLLRLAFDNFEAFRGVYETDKEYFNICRGLVNTCFHTRANTPLIKLNEEGNYADPRETIFPSQSLRELCA
jgi:hypothetical protein